MIGHSSFFFTSTTIEIETEKTYFEICQGLIQSLRTGIKVHVTETAPIIHLVRALEILEIDGRSFAAWSVCSSFLWLNECPILIATVQCLLHYPKRFRLFTVFSSKIVDGFSLIWNLSEVGFITCKTALYTNIIIL